MKTVVTVQNPMGFSSSGHNRLGKNGIIHALKLYGQSEEMKDARRKKFSMDDKARTHRQEIVLLQDRREQKNRR